jgi:hypothetical protein
MGILRAIATGIDTLKHKDYPDWHPINFGLPDLKGTKFDRKPSEPNFTCYMRRANAIKDFVESNLKVEKGGNKLDICLFWKQLQFITDCFYGEDIDGNRVKKVILWKNRGGGGSLCVAIILFLRMIYDGWPAIDMGGSLEQAKQVYSYTTYFWECLPKLSKTLLDGVPRRTETKLKNGCSLQCIPASEKQSRSKHVPLFVADEACQKDDRVGEFVNTAIQGVYSEPEHLIIWVSTFHVATGYFQDLVDNAEQYGIKVYYWNVFDAMEECNVGLEHATDKDPNAKKYCMEKCPLTRRERKYDEDGNFTHIEYNWCCGTARRSNGFFTYENVLDSMRNSSGDTFHVEHACNRPVSAGPVYHPEHVKGSFVNVLPLVDRGKRELREKASKVVGIDWGWTGETSVVGPIHFTGETLEIPKTMYFSGVGVEDLSVILEQLRNEYGDFGIYCDSSHPFVIDYLMNHGWEIVPVSFKKWKEYGIGNVARWLARKKIKISKNDTGNLKLKTQLLLYYRDKNGKPSKKDDHGPDALMCGVLNWNFLDYFSESALDDDDDDDYLIEEVPEESYGCDKVPIDEKNIW